jgi:hypothetical protein
LPNKTGERIVMVLSRFLPQLFTLAFGLYLLAYLSNL